MDNIARAKWIASFDMESLISSILRTGMLISMSLTLLSLVPGWLEKGQVDFGPNMKAKSIPLLILADFQQIHVPGFWPRLLMHLGFAVLLLTPFVRVVASLVYFTLVERSPKQALFTTFVLVILTIILLTNLV